MRCCLLLLAWRLAFCAKRMLKERVGYSTSDDVVLALSSACRARRRHRHTLLASIRGHDNALATLLRGGICTDIPLKYNLKKCVWSFCFKSIMLPPPALFPPPRKRGSLVR